MEIREARPSQYLQAPMFPQAVIEAAKEYGNNIPNL